MSRNDRTLTPRGRRLAFSFGTAAGAAVIAAVFSMGTAPVASAIGDADPISDLIAALDPSAFNALGLPDDALGLLAAGLDNDLLAPLGLGALLDPIVDDLVGSGGFFGVGNGLAGLLDEDPISDLIGAIDPSAFNALGAPDDLLGFLASGLDNDLLAPLGLGALLDPIVDDLVGSGSGFFGLF